MIGRNGALELLEQSRGNGIEQGPLVDPAELGFGLLHRHGGDKTGSTENSETAFGEQKGTIRRDQLMRTDHV